MQISAVKIAQKSAGLPDAEYRKMLFQLTGQTSSTRCNDIQLRKVYNALNDIARHRFPSAKSPMERKLWALWYDFSPNLPEHQRNVSYLTGIVRRASGRDDIQRPADFVKLTPRELYKTVEALKIKSADVDPAPF